MIRVDRNVFEHIESYCSQCHTGSNCLAAYSRTPSTTLLRIRAASNYRGQPLFAQAPVQHHLVSRRRHSATHMEGPSRKASPPRRVSAERSAARVRASRVRARSLAPEARLDTPRTPSRPLRRPRDQAAWLPGGPVMCRYIHHTRTSSLPRPSRVPRLHSHPGRIPPQPAPEPAWRASTGRRRLGAASAPPSVCRDDCSAAASRVACATVSRYFSCISTISSASETIRTR